MQNIENLTKRRLAQGRLCIGFVAHQMRGAAIPVLAQAAGYDWLFVDLEHSSQGTDNAIQMCITALSIGIMPVVRLNEGVLHDAGRLLDHGAAGIVAPHVDDVESAMRAVRFCKFPPIGERSWIGAGPFFHYAPVPPKVAQPILNNETLVVVQIETALAVENAFEIAAVPGVDVLMIGTGDLTTSLGVPGDIGHERVRSAYETVAQACANHGKYLGMGGVYDEKFARLYISRGARFLLGGSDQNFLFSAASQRAQFLQSLDNVIPLSRNVAVAQEGRNDVLLAAAPMS
jgi:2-keto-3-deoxy-L-rhamnonate aldolase RhmA